MKKGLFYKTIGVCAFSITTPVFLSSCSYVDKNTYTFVLSSTANKGSATKFVNDVQNTFNNLKEEDAKYSNLEDIKIELKQVNDNKSKKDLLENGTGSFAFMTSQSLREKNFYKKVSPSIQTLTTPFVFDLDMSKTYSDGLDNDPLRIIANDMQEKSFGKDYSHPLSSWKDDKGPPPNFDWNGIRYNAFYDEQAELVNGYRGMIVLSGDDKQINDATNYWNKKDWNSFRNLGIIVGDETSSGNYKLQEKLIKTHFGFGNDWTIATDKKSNPEKYETDKYGTNKIGKSKDFVISFTDEGSFAWTHNTTTNVDYKPLEGSKIKILTVTNPGIYDVGTFSKAVNEDVKELMIKSIISLYQNNNNTYGEGLGYNGYSRIKDFEKEVLEPLSKSLG